mgnify:CR=1 FL=1
MRVISDVFFHHIDHFRFERMLAADSGSGRRTYSTVAFEHAVYALQRHLRALGLRPGDRVAIFADNRPEWHIADFAIQLARLVSVPLYATLAPAQVRFLLEHSGCRAALVAGRARREMVKQLRTELPELEWVISLDDAAPPSLDEIVEATPPPGSEDWQPIREAADQVDPGELATIVYTSGTTGTPKGVMLSHANIVFDLEACLERLGFRSTSQALSVLPLSHVFERILCYGYFYQGVPIAYGDPHDLGRLLKTYRPRVMGCVPRILEKIHETIQANIGALPGWKQRISGRLIRAALARDRARFGQDRAAWSDRPLAGLARAVVFRRIRRELGGLEYLVCGGAWLDFHIEEFFRAAGFGVVQGYGLTETSPVICLNPPGGEVPGSVGAPLRGIEIRLSDEGEILVRGGNVMMGYYQDPEASAATFDSGWLRTGDLGRIDRAGNLFITGRCREVIVLSTGKNVCCPLIEHAIVQSPLVQEAFVLGHGRKFVSAILVPHWEHLLAAAREAGLGDLPENTLMKHPRIAELYYRDLDALQAGFSHYERAKRFAFLPPAALADRELVTPTLKVRRNVLESKYGGWIDKMYATDEVVVLGEPEFQTSSGREGGAALHFA